MASTPKSTPTLDESYDDISLVLLALSAHVQQRSEELMAEAGFGDLRTTHGYVFQHLIPGPKSVTQLAEALGMTNQGASKTVIELEGMGYVTRSVSPDDARARVVGLTAKGHDAIEAGRTARRRINRELSHALSDSARAPWLRGLERMAKETGALETMFERRLRPPR